MIKNKIIYLLSLFVILTFFACKTKPLLESQPTDEDLVICFGSCNKTYLGQFYWNNIEAQNPDLFIWIGDNIYADTEEPKVMAQKYDALKNNAEYKKFAEKHKIVGTWDDHDYGKNDAGIEYPMKEESKRQLMNFLGVEDKKVLKRPGVYQSYDLNLAEKKIKLILLDTRWFRTALKRDSITKAYVPTNGDMLGEEQWEWLTKELEDKADLYIIGSSIQLIPEEHPYEKWANMPKERLKLIDLLKNKKALILSGDRHIAEFSQMKYKDINIIEFTSSGLNNTWRNKNQTEANRYRVGPLIIDENFGKITITLDENNEILLNMEVINNRRYRVFKLDFSWK